MKPFMNEGRIPSEGHHDGKLIPCIKGAHRPRLFRLLWSMIALQVTSLTTGCVIGMIGDEPIRIGTPEAPFVQEGKRIKADPVAYLRDLRDRCERMDSYQLTFYRQERLGLLVRELKPMEEIRARFRRDPFSVKFEWDSPNSEYVESVYVAGDNNEKLMVRQRKGLLGFPPQILKVSVADPVIWGKAKNAITDFGLARVTQRTLLPFEDPKLAGAMTITYEGLVRLDPTHRPAHYLRIERPPMKGFAYTRQDFYVDAETLLPTGTDLWLPSGELDARYRYANVDADATFDDVAFQLSKAPAVTHANDQE